MTDSEELSCVHVACKELNFGVFSNLSICRPLDLLYLFNRLSNTFTESDVVFQKFAIENYILLTRHAESFQDMIDLRIRIFSAHYQPQDLFILLIFQIFLILSDLFNS